MFINPDHQLWQTLEKIAQDEGLVLYDLERTGGGLRVLVDKQGGVTSGETSSLCRRLMVYFQVEGSALGVGSEPEIEVSSPGINRTLRLNQHWSGAVGERVKVVFHEPVGGHLHAAGKLELADGSFRVVSPQGAVDFGMGVVKRAQIDFEF